MPLENQFFFVPTFSIIMAFSNVLSAWCPKYKTILGIWHIVRLFQQICKSIKNTDPTNYRAIMKVSGSVTYSLTGCWSWLVADMGANDTELILLMIDTGTHSDLFDWYSWFVCIIQSGCSGALKVAWNSILIINIAWNPAGTNAGHGFRLFYCLDSR